jgi:hypothetical protein
MDVTLDDDVFKWVKMDGIIAFPWVLVSLAKAAPVVTYDHNVHHLAFGSEDSVSELPILNTA